MQYFIIMHNRNLYFILCFLFKIFHEYISFQLIQQPIIHATSIFKNYRSILRISNFNIVTTLILYSIRWYVFSKILLSTYFHIHIPHKHLLLWLQILLRRLVWILLWVIVLIIMNRLLQCILFLHWQLFFILFNFLLPWLHCKSYLTYKFIR